MSESIVGSCFRKQRYPTQKRALAVAEMRTARSETPLRVYACGACGGWHLSRVWPTAVRPGPTVLEEIRRHPASAPAELALLAERAELRRQRQAMCDAIREGRVDRVVGHAEVRRLENELGRIKKILKARERFYGGTP